MITDEEIRDALDELELKLNWDESNVGFVLFTFRFWEEKTTVKYISNTRISAIKDIIRDFILQECSKSDHAR